MCAMLADTAAATLLVAILGPVLVLIGVLYSTRATIAANRQARDQDRETEQRRTVEERRHDDERAVIAVRQAIRDQARDRVRGMVEEVMALLLTVRRGEANDQVDPMRETTELAVWKLAPSFQLEPGGDELAEALLELRVAVMTFANSIQVQRKMADAQQAGRVGGIIRRGELLDKHRAEVTTVMARTRALAVSFWNGYHVPVLSEELAEVTSALPAADERPPAQA